MKTRILLMCLFSMVLSTTYAQIDTRQRNVIKTKITTVDDISHIQSKELKSIWKPSYIHVIAINKKASLKDFIRLNKYLTEAPLLYNPQNTLIICEEKMVEWVKEAATGYDIFPLHTMNLSNEMIIEGTMVPLTSKDNTPDYDFKFTKEKNI